MKQENRQFLEDNYGHWITLRDANFIRNLNMPTKEGMQRVMSEEFIPGYSTCLWCPTDVASLVKELYQRYDQWKINNAEPVAEPTLSTEPPQTEIATSTEDILPPGAQIVKANFPSNKKHKRR